MNTHYIKTKNSIAPTDNLHKLTYDILQTESLMDLEVVYVEMSKYCWHNNLVCPSYISVKESLERLVESGVTEQLTQQDIKAMLLNKKIAMFDDPLDAWGGV